MKLLRNIGLGMVPTGKRSVRRIPAHVLAMVPKPTDANITVKESDADPIADTVPLIKQKIKRTSWQVKKLAKHLKGATLAQTLRNNYNFIFDHIQYVKDEPGQEQVRSPRRLIHDGKGDCDCFTVCLGAFLTEQKIPFKIRVSANQEPAQWGHVYVVVPKDGNTNKELRNKSEYYVLDPVVHQFNYEAPFYNTKDFAMKLVSMDGLGDACESKNTLNTILNTRDNGTAIPQFRRFIDTRTVIDLGLVPTRNFLTREGIAFRENTTLEGTNYVITTPTGEQQIPTILTQEQSEEVKQLVSGVSPTTAQPAPFTMDKKQEASGILVGIALLGGLVWSAFS